MIALAVMLGGLGLFFLRHQQGYGRGVAEDVSAAILALDTPLARAPRRREPVERDGPVAQRR